MQFIKLIIEGCDGSGKSTLVTNLKNIYNTAIFTANFTAPPKDIDRHIWGYTYFEPSIFNLFTFIYNNIIIDRCYLSEAVYRNIYNKKLPKYNFTNIDLYAKNKKFIHIYCKPSLNTIINNINIRKDWLIKDINILKYIYNNYELYIKNIKTPIIIYDYTKDSLELLINKIKEIYEKLE